ncbi:MAG: Gx transporter family protein [Lachnospiraceae bacterium]|nr:Gx transporter family protein [Lachnospiraceae bacterium]
MLSPNKKTDNLTRKVALSGILTCLALVFSYVEHLIPIPFPVPGVKLGLANLVVLSGLYILSPVNVLLILTARVILAAFMFGNLSSLAFSLCGGILSFFVMLSLKRTLSFSKISVSIAGGAAHNLGQFAVAFFFLKSKALLIYLSPLILLGALSGALIGIICAAVSKYFKSLN